MSITSGSASFTWSPPRQPVNPAGKVFYVDNSTNGTVTYAAESRFASLALALAQCVDYRGDIIYVAPNHSENVASTLSVSVPCVSIVGLGGYGTRPTFTYTADTATIAVSAADVSLENLNFVSNTADVGVAGDAGCLTVTAKGLSVRNCSFKEGSALAISTAIFVGAADNDSDGLLVEDCVFIQPDAASENGIYFAKNIAGAVIKGNYFYSDFAHAGTLAQGCIAAGAAEVTQYIRIIGNIMHDLSTDGDENLINLAAATGYGTIAYNLGYSADADAGDFVEGAHSLFENYITNAIASSGALNPAVE